MLARYAGPRHTTHDLALLVTRWVATVATLALLAGGCSSSSTDDDTADTTTGDTRTTDATVPTTDSSQPDGTDSGDDSGRSPGAVTLIDAGVEPRDELRINADAQSRISVDASDSLTITIDGATTDEAGVARYQLDLDISVSGADGVQLLVVPTIESIDGPIPGADGLGTWQWFLDTHGVVQRVIPIGWSDRVDDATLELLSVANLVLVTPVEPVGAGATWSQSLNRQSEAQLVFTLDSVTDTDLEVTVELIAPFEEGVATMAASGTYDRSTLLARNVTTDSTLEVTSPVTDNGELVELTAVQHSRRTYVGVTG